MSTNSFIAIDLKSFYASVECVERKLDPLTTNLVVADIERTEKTICLAVSPSLKAYGIPGRARLFEVVQRVKEVNAERKAKIPNGTWRGKSFHVQELKEHPDYELSYIVACPRMAMYMAYSTKIYNIYLKYVAPEDIHVYSIDEVFMDVTHYLKTYQMTARELASKMIQDIMEETGITATAGIGTNLYLCKVAMDIVAKHTAVDENGVRIAELDEMSYRKILWNHRPLTDFWRVGRGYRKKLEENGMFTMGDIARCSIGSSANYYNEDLLYRLFGINAELLIDHAWGYEPVTMAMIKQYKPETESISAGQVLTEPHRYMEARLITKEMADIMALDLVAKKLVTNQLVLTIGYDIENLKDTEKRKKYKGEIVTDHYGRSIPKHAHGTINLEEWSSSSKAIVKAMMELYDRIVDQSLLIRRISIAAGRLQEEDKVQNESSYEQLELFTDYDSIKTEKEEKKKEKERERKLQEAMLAVKNKYGKNAILKGTNLEKGATAMERNRQIGGHRA